MKANKNTLYLSLAILLAIFIGWIHFWKIDILPAGLYVDESSIGSHAASLSHNLRDANDQFLPVFFEGAGHYISPIYIYAAALMMKVFGVGELALRLTSFAFFIILAVGSIMLTRKIFPKHPITTLYTLFVIGTLPWLFSLSRVSFDTIAQPAILVWVLYYIYIAYQQLDAKDTIYQALIAGLLTGLTFYSSSTGRFLAFVTILSILIVYRSRDYWKRHIYLLGGFVVSLIPYLYFSATGSTAAGTKLNFLSYFYVSDLSLADKLRVLFSNYFSYFDPGFLLLAGDSNLRHHTGSMGMLYLAVAILVILGVAFIVILKNSHHRYFGWLLVISALTSPLAAAIIDRSHAQLSLVFGFYLIMLSIYGMAALELLPKQTLRRASIGILTVALLVQSSFYLNHYFNVYPPKTIQAFGSFDLHNAFQTAIDHQPQQIIVSNHTQGSQIHLDFYDKFLNLNTDQLTTVVQTPIANPGYCLVTFNDDPAIDNPDNLSPQLAKQFDHTNLTCY